MLNNSLFQRFKVYLFGCRNDQKQEPIRYSLSFQGFRGDTEIVQSSPGATADEYPIHFDSAHLFGRFYVVRGVRTGHQRFNVLNIDFQAL
jgi:hypothetical protein